jgi:hypothetical protein
MTAKERADCLIKAEHAEAMAAQFAAGSYFHESWTMIAEGYRNAAEEPDLDPAQEQTGPR